MGEGIQTVVVAVDQANLDALVDYSVEHGSEHDESYLPTLEINLEEQPSFLLKSGDQVVGAVSLIRSERYLAERKARFAIFHSVLGTREAYRRMFDAIACHFDGVDSTYLFLPQDRSETARILEGLGFDIERYSYVLVNRNLQPCDPCLPSGYVIRPVSSEDIGSLDLFARLINRNFSPLAGHLDTDADGIRAWFDDDVHLADGLCLLEHEGKAIGTAYVTKDVSDPTMAELSALSIESHERGQGLGRSLLRWAGDFAAARGFESLVLSVNAENDTAVELYRSAGFEQVEVVVCYQFAPAG